nr:PaaX family transcriptional regulator C-terminal domain-containing protein [Marinicella sp. W31]MDC2878561.1 PaaX family transcriptional regulator C-terminal domain-containing protein [Marinicella sp. W31]
MLDGVGNLSDFARRLWPLDAVAAAYRDFITTFAPVDDALSSGFSFDGATALALRLRLVHLFRAAALADPRLPGDALPSGWPAAIARRLL